MRRCELETNPDLYELYAWSYEKTGQKKNGQMKKSENAYRSWRHASASRSTNFQTFSSDQFFLSQSASASAGVGPRIDILLSQYSKMVVLMVVSA
jgi:hypothetical protein